MNRLLDITPAEESEVITRILVAVHQAIDANFANAAAPPRRFTKTTFSDQMEDTNLNPLPVMNESNDVAVTKEKMVRLDQAPQDDDDFSASPPPPPAPAADAPPGDSMFFSHLTSAIPNNPHSGGGKSLEPNEFTDLKKIGRPKSSFLKAFVLLIIIATLLGMAAMWVMTNLGVQSSVQ